MQQRSVNPFRRVAAIGALGLLGLSTTACTPEQVTDFFGRNGFQISPAQAQRLADLATALMNRAGETKIEIKVGERKPPKKNPRPERGNRGSTTTTSTVPTTTVPG